MKPEPRVLKDEIWMRRCFQLAQLGAGAVSPNPLVGAVLVFDGKIIGEGWHQRWGEAHGEVNCIHSVSAENQALIPHSTLYCNLEPCSHFGKTPPCADLILAHKIPQVVIANTDPNPLVAGAGIAKLRNAGIEVREGVLADEGRWLNRIFFTWIIQKRPYIVLKWAQTADGFLGKAAHRTAISTPSSARLVHRWRSELDAILVGTTTAMLDNPRLDKRHYFGRNPLRIAFDLEGKIPSHYHLLDDSTETWIFGKNNPERPEYENTKFIPTDSKPLINNVLDALKQGNRASLLVEGGAYTLNQFLNLGLWDEIRILENPKRLGEGVAAPKCPPNAILNEQFDIGADQIRIFARQDLS